MHHLLKEAIQEQHLRRVCFCATFYVKNSLFTPQDRRKYRPGATPGGFKSTIIYSTVVNWAIFAKMAIAQGDITRVKLSFIE